jgi:hypothetical protein
MGVLAGDPVGREDVDAVDGARGDPVAESLRRRPSQGLARRAVVDERELQVQLEAIVCDPLLERVHLAADRIGLGLMLGGGAGGKRGS